MVDTNRECQPPIMNKILHGCADTNTALVFRLMLLSPESN
jgi:hypothetical protein